ncbi:rhodanese-like domain-containing protein [Flavobacterium sp. HNIBRBA15423]|uniref:rhodanese-like domain-containing protein n=1 Tax=Flavobacterium sp. HNIBRBA15423 TaxID=3458683 RepID=UPI0040446358
MKTNLITLLIMALPFTSFNTQQDLSDNFTPSIVDFDAFETLTKEVKSYRKDRLINWSTFEKFSKETNTIILDTRSKEMFEKKHIKGAIHLNFSDFTQENLAQIIPSFNTRILIYCNNNIDKEPILFASKISLSKKDIQPKSISLALNIPTFINLYGYGYKNVYELSELISAFDTRITFEGTEI